MARLVPSAPVAVMETEAAFVVCHVRVTDWPDVTLLLLAANVRVGVGFGGGAVELEPEPEPQPVIATSTETTAIPNSAWIRVMNGPLLMKNEVTREAPGCCYASCFRFLSQSVQRIDDQENDPAVIKVKQHSYKGHLPTMRSFLVCRGLAKFLPSSNFF